MKARAEAQRGQFARVLEAVENRFDSKWGPRRALGLEKGEAFDFEAAGRATAQCSGMPSASPTMIARSGSPPAWITASFTCAPEGLRAVTRSGPTTASN